MKRKEAIKEAIAIRSDYEDGKLNGIEFKTGFARLSDASGISYEELLSESVI